MRRLLFCLIALLAVPLSQLRADPNTGVTTHWSMDEASPGTRVDAVGSEDLTDFGTNITAVAGVISNAARFVSGSNMALVAVDSAALSVDSNTFTISTWASIHASAANDGSIATKGDTGAYEYFFGWDFSDNKWTFQVCTAGFTCDTVQWASSPSTGTPYFVMAGHRNGSNIWIRVNCGAEVTTSHTGGGQSTTGSLRIGAGYYNEFYYGDLDEVTTWNGADTSTDCNTLYNAGSGVSYPFPMGGGGSSIRSFGPAIGVF